MRIQPSGNVSNVDKAAAPAPKPAAKPAASPPAATVQLSKAALQAAARSGDVDHDGDSK